MPEGRAAPLRAGHTHLYPGARLRAARRPRWRKGSAVVVEFADLGAAMAVVERACGDRAVLSVAAHRTARGTAVAAKRWLVERIDDAADADATAWRVVGRAEPGP